MKQNIRHITFQKLFNYYVIAEITTRLQRTAQEHQLDELLSLKQC